MHNASCSNVFLDNFCLYFVQHYSTLFIEFGHFLRFKYILLWNFCWYVLLPNQFDITCLYYTQNSYFGEWEELVLITRMEIFSVHLENHLDIWFLTCELLDKSVCWLKISFFEIMCLPYRFYEVSTEIQTNTQHASLLKKNHSQIYTHWPLY